MKAGGIFLYIASRAVNACRTFGLPGHTRRIKKSRRTLRLLRSFDGDFAAARCVAYLRKVDTLLFEEIVLSALERAGAFVIRNQCYVGDGGIDGRCWIPGIGWCALQCKRYGRHIDHQHVAEFGNRVERKRFILGLFVHTGRTGGAAYGQLAGLNVRLVSGERLTKLVRQEASLEELVLRK